MAVLHHEHLLVSVELKLVQMVVVNIDLFTQIWQLIRALLQLNQHVLAVEAERRVAAAVEPVHAALRDVVRLVKKHCLAAVLLINWWARVLLEPVNEVGPGLGVGLHPLSHHGNAKADFNDPVDNALHNLIEHSLLQDLLLEEVFEHASLVDLHCKQGVAVLGSLHHNLQEYQERPNLVKVVLRNTLGDDVEELHDSCLVVECMDYVRLRKRHKCTALVGSSEQLDDELYIWLEQYLVLLGEQGLLVVFLVSRHGLPRTCVDTFWNLHMVARD